ncbi:MAG: hypothetical protein CYG61_05285, partial [Actinobacteria bacterium]
AGAGAGAVAATSAVGGTASLAVASVALLAAGLIGVRTVDPSSGNRPSKAPQVATPALAAPVPQGTDGLVPVALVDDPVAGVEVPAPGRIPRLAAGPHTSAVSAPDLAPPTPTASAPEAISMMDPVAQLGIWVPGPVAVALALGESTTVCPGVQMGTVELGCVPDEPAGGTGVTVSTGGTAVPENEITVPLRTGGKAVPETEGTTAVPTRTRVPAPTVSGRSSVGSDAVPGPAARTR